MTTMQKMLSEIRELDSSEWDAVGGMGPYGPTQEASFTPTYCRITGTYNGQYFTAQDDGGSDTTYD